jgi:murein DD-endopeptidase MepM/ murein hydrolase activator NlpD
MRKVVAFSKVALLTRVSVACVLAASVSACGTDSVRLAENPFSNPFASSTATKRVADPASTGSISKAVTGSTGTGLLGSSVTSAPLAAVPAAVKPLASAPASSIRTAAAATVTPRPPASLASPVTTGSLAKGSAAVSSVAGWSASGGTPVTLAHGESVDTLSGRYGVPAAAILGANGLPKGASITPGTKVIIPVYNASAKAGGQQVAQASSFSSDMARNTPPAPITSAVEGAKEKARLAAEAKAKSETQARVDAAEARAAAAEARAKADQQARLAAEERAGASAKAKTATDSTSKAQALKAAAEAKTKSDAAARVATDLKAREKLAEAKAKAAEARTAEAKATEAKTTEAKTRTVEAKPAATKASIADAAAAKAKLATEAKAKAEEKLKVAAEAKAKAEAKALADAKTKQGAKVASVPAPAPAEEPKTTASVAREEPAPKAATADFRWPARGRVITGFSGKGGNEGINIAVPEGTPVKAAEGGTVAYSGNELKGYGNLVLIRHDNGYVSAYAHNGDINVKRGEKVTRGQTIAKSGQSGNVSSPQLHFELRKGSSPVDPMPYLDN